MYVYEITLKIVQSEHFDLSVILALVDTTLHMLDAYMEYAAKWILQLVNFGKEFDAAIGVTIPVPNYHLLNVQDNCLCQNSRPTFLAALACKIQCSPQKF